MDALLDDLKHAFRSLRRSPAFAAAAILSLGLAIGADTAVFSLVDSLLVRPLPYADPARLISQGARLALLAVALGVPASLALARLLGSLLYGVAPTDAATHVATSAAVLALALIASWLPARRASRIDPVSALRAE